MAKNLNTIAFIQARLSSKRFPKKILKKINNVPLIEFLILRLKKSKKISKIVIATTTNKEDRKLRKIANKLNCDIFFGDDNDVLNRFYKLSLKYKNFENIVRITGDCPLIDTGIVDRVINLFEKEKVDYCSNVNPPTFPDGLDVEIFSKKILKEAWEKSKNLNEREHVTPYMVQNNNVSKANFLNNKDYSDYRLTVDEQKDLKPIKEIIKKFYPNIHFNFNDLVNNFIINKKIKPQKEMRNLGSKIGNGPKLWKYAKSIIPGGNMFFSKNSENFLPDQWPSYYSRSKKCFIWDLDKKKYLDMSLMGVGTNILGYANNKIDNKVILAIKSGNMTTLNSYAEVEFSEKLLSINEWAEKVKICKTGADANSISIRLARAATGKTKVAVCGYHGWHDWYLAANLKNKNNLDAHLLKNLNPLGVPLNLKNTIYTFEYNNFKQIDEIVKKHNLAAIKIEVKRNYDPKNQFLEKIRKLASKNNIVLIFDECTSAFRETFGGLYKKFNVVPDIALYGKALGNGYPITAIVGKREIMDFAQETFISSTFWSDKIGPVAGLETLREMERIKSWKIISNIGKKIKKKWLQISKENDLDIEVRGIESLPNFYFKEKNNLIYKTFITQEMLKKNIIAGQSIYVCVDHDEVNLERYFDNLNEIFKIIKKNNNNDKLKKLLNGPVCNSDFQRMN